MSTPQKNGTQPKPAAAETKAAAEPQNAAPQAAKPQPAAISPEQMQKRIMELEALLKEKPKNLNEAIQFYQEKQRKINDLATFTEHGKTLIEALGKVSQKVNAGELDTKLYSLKMTVFNDYREGEKVFSITNSLIIEACINIMLDKINEKAQQLRKEIEE
jgi:hypothetical protein